VTAKPSIQDQIIDAVTGLLDLATAYHPDPVSDETLTECHACGEWEGHAESCFVPALERWQNAPSPEYARIGVQDPRD
jgi:hypothetical protein